VRIRGIELDLFGPHLHTTGVDLADGLVVIYGPNEAGKSSLLAALRGVLFGRAAGDEPDLGVQTGSRAKLTLQTDAGLASVERPLGAKKPPKLILPDGTAVAGEAAFKQLVPALNVVDESIFRAIFTFQLAELNDLSQHKDLSSQMYAAGLIGQVSPLGIEQQLFARARELYNPNTRARKQPLNECLNEIKQWVKDIAAAKDKPEDYLRAQADVEALQARLVQLTSERDGLQQTVTGLQKDTELLPLHRALVTARAQLQSMGPVPQTDPYDLSALQHRHEELKRLKEDLQDVKQAEVDVAAKETDCDSLLQRLAAGWSVEVLRALHVDEQLTVQAQQLAEEWRAQRQSLDRLRERLADSERGLTRATDVLHGVGLTPPTATKTLAEQEDRLAAADAQREADYERLQRLERLSAEGKALLEQSERRTERPSRQGFSVLRMVIGILLLASAAIAVWQRDDIVAVLTGLVGVWSLLNLEQRFASPHPHDDGGDHARQSAQDVRTQVIELQQALVGVTLPGDPLTFSQADWQTAHDTLRQQERTAEVNRRTLREQTQAWHDVQEAETQRQRCVDVMDGQLTQLEATRVAFGALCRRLGAPTLSTPEVLPAELERILHWQAGCRELQRLKSRLWEKRQRLVTGLVALREACQDMMMSNDTNDTSAAETAVAVEQNDTVESHLDTQIWALEQQLAHLAVEAERVMAAVTEQRKHHQSLMNRIEQGLNQAAGMCGSLKVYEQRAPILDDLTVEGLQAELASKRDALTTVQTALDEAREQLGAVTTRVQTWSANVTTDKEWALSEAKATRAELASRWAVLTMAQALVREARERFEAQRQPAVLGQAGELLADWTGGRYRRLQARADESGQPQLLCIDGAGEAWEPKRLSRGTREQIYLCLRFAMIEDYRAKGAVLPVVLDDPMVNFDMARLTRAMQFVANRAVGTQTLYLTCQSHVAEAASGLGAQVLVLTGEREKQLVSWEDSHGAN
jgi:uncharacterized protein YhaN